MYLPEILKYVQYKSLPGLKQIFVTQKRHCRSNYGVFLDVDLHVKAECTFIFVKGCALSDSHHVSTKSDWIDNTEFAAQGGRGWRGKKAKQLYVFTLHFSFRLLWGLDNTPAMNET